MNSSAPKIPWYKQLNGYHWWIFIICSLGWLFDTMDQRLFVLGRNYAMKELVPAGGDVVVFGRYATTIFMFGWATGGIIFGILGDKWGRAKTMMLTILVYACFTALSGLARNPYDFMFYRFLTGLGVGGEFSAGISLLAEVIPEGPRPYALGVLQGLSAVGNIVGSTIGFYVLQNGGEHWRWLFYIGAIPALLVVFIMGKLKEPETWVRSKAHAMAGTGLRMGSYRDLFMIPRWRKNALIGATIAVVGVTGVWGIGFYSPELVGDALAGFDKATIGKKQALMTGFQDFGAFFSMSAFAFISTRIGRRPTFWLACAFSMIVIFLVFGFLSSPGQVIPFGFLLGLGLMGLFGGYAVYFPEIFPTRLRSTGVSFCYNVGRYLAAILNLTAIYLKEPMQKAFPNIPAFRSTAIAMSMIYLIGIIVISFGPETKDKPLPKDEDEESQPTPRRKVMAESKA